MKFSIPLSQPALVNYPVKVGLQILTSTSNTDIYNFDYSQLSIANVASKPFIENIDQVSQLYDGFSNNAASLISKRQANGMVTYSNGQSVPSYGKRGVFVFVISAETEHPVATCQTWLDAKSALTTTSYTKCPGTFAQMPQSLLANPRTIKTTENNIDYYFIPEKASQTMGKVCGYMSDGTFLDPTNHVAYNGKTLYR
jgi:hypothetical protein